MSKKIKNILLSFLALVVSVGVVLLSAFRVSGTQAQTQMGLDPSPDSERVQVEVLDTKTLDVITTADGVDYYLPYPGILPDHPLYWLKMIRDRILLFLTRSSEDKMSRLLLYADKRIGAAQALIKGGKDQLGVTTATKAEKYLERSLAELEKLYSQEKSSSEMFQRLSKASLKHKQVINDLLNDVSDQTKPALEKALQKADAVLQKAAEFGNIKIEENKPEPSLEPSADSKGCNEISCPI
jgi:hypothetical protein